MTSTATSTLSVAGELITGPDLIDVRSPFSDEVVGIVPTVEPPAVVAAIDAAHAAMTAGLPAHRRAEILDDAARHIEHDRDRYAKLLALEVAKPMTAARTEIDRAIQTLRFSAVEARTLAGDCIELGAHPAGVGRVGWTMLRPIGVVAAITPFNFPFNLAVHKIGPAIAAGCGVVVKPPRSAPLTAIALADTLYEAGLPREWLSVVVGSASAIGDVFVDDPRVAMITFTGSSEVGWELAARAPRKHVALELGNSTPVIICADADLQRAATTLAGSAFTFAGQSCISVQRLICHESAQAHFSELFVEAAAGLAVGDPLDDKVAVGPPIDNESRERIVEWIDHARDTGATLLSGGDVVDGCVLPTVLRDVDTNDPVWSKEVFGPVASIRPFADIDDALDLANGTDYGLQAGIYTSDLSTALRAAERLEFGGVTINETPTFRVDQMPYGGTKESGNTREGPHYTVRAMTEQRMVVINP